jgi:hypothetical protein
VCFSLDFCQNSVVELNCEYITDRWDNWLVDTSCKVDSQEFKAHIQYLFTDDLLQNHETFGVEFSEIGSYVPKEIFEDFPAMKGLVIKDSNLSILQFDLFSNEQFSRIEYLNLKNNEIETIKFDAFSNFINLIWLGLMNNKIEKITCDIFKNNLKLQYIDFESNNIKALSGKLFEKLSLKFLDLDHNKCVNKQMGCNTCSLAFAEIKSELQSCFWNCPEDVTCEGRFEMEAPHRAVENRNATTSIQDIAQKIQYFEEECSRKVTSTIRAEQSLQNKKLEAKLKAMVENLEKRLSIIETVQNITVDNLSETGKLEVETLTVDSFVKPPYIESNQKIIESIKKEIFENYTRELSSQLEKTENRLKLLVENLSLKFSEINLMRENETLRFKLMETELKKDIELKDAKCMNEKLAMELKMNQINQQMNHLEVKVVQQEIVFESRIKTLKNDFENREAELKRELEIEKKTTREELYKNIKDIVNQKLEALRNEALP